jgi:hypothetical protein
MLFIVPLLGLHLIKVPDEEVDAADPPPVPTNSADTCVQ